MLPLILLAFIAAAPIRAGETITPAEANRILAGTTVFLKIRPDTIPIGYADSGRILLVKIGDSSYVLPDKSQLMISRLAIRRAQEVLPVTDEIWITSKHATATVSLGFHDPRGKSESFRAHLDTADIERIFLPDAVPASSKRIDPGTKGFLVVASALVGGIIGGVYGKAHGGSAGIYSGLAGFSIGLVYGLEFILPDG